MSYTTMNRYGEVSHVYAPTSATGYIRGCWWPDFGPRTAEYSHQHNMHPTNTIFENQMVKHKNLLSSKSMGSSEGSHRSREAPSVQFRRPAPQTEALWSSTIIQPYRSGGHARAIAEGAWHQKALVSHESHEEAQSTLKFKKALERDSVTQSFSPTRSRSAPQLLRPLASGKPLLPGGSPLLLNSADHADEDPNSKPSWLASSTLYSRPTDAAGMAGTTKHRFHITGARDFGLEPGSPTARILGQRSIG